MLGIGAAMLGSPHVIGVDIDEDALQTAQQNCQQYEDLQVSVMMLMSYMCHHFMASYDMWCHTLA